LRTSKPRRLRFVQLYDHQAIVAALSAAPSAAAAADVYRHDRWQVGGAALVVHEFAGLAGGAVAAIATLSALEVDADSFEPRIVGRAELVPPRAVGNDFTKLYARHPPIVQFGTVTMWNRCRASTIR
jgi:hypothetical protein